MGPISLTLLVLAVLISLVVGASMLRQPALRRLGLRNLGRRKWNTVLVVAGSMTGTALIAGSLVLSDSTGRLQYTQARDSLGEIDEVVSLSIGARPAVPFELAAVSAITPANVSSKAAELGNEPVQIDGVMPVLIQDMPAEALGDGADTARLVSPAVTLIGVEWDGLRTFGSDPPEVASLRAPGAAEVYVSEKLASTLELRTGSRLRLRGPRGTVTYTVAGVMPQGGISGYTSGFSSSEGNVLTSIASARSLLGVHASRVNTLFISNAGDVTSGVEASGPVTNAVEALLGGKAPGTTAFTVTAIKQRTLDGGGFAISDVFLALSSFSILAGILLIVNIYTMLAEERKGELGVLRAIALKRSGLVRVFLYEGYAYSLLASLAGAVVGLGIAAGLVWGLNQATSVLGTLFNADFSFPFYAEPGSLIAAASAGLLITFLTVVFTSLRISGLNIVTAIRDLPEQQQLRTSIRGLIGRPLLLILGLALTGWAAGTGNGVLLLVGPVVAAFGVGVLLARVLPPRAVWTAIGGAVLAYGYFANDLGPIAEASSGNPLIFFLEGFFMVPAAVVLVSYNLSFLFGLLKVVTRWMPPLAPVLRLAVAYPAAKRGRTALTLAMFALVLYLVTISSLFASSQSAAAQSTRDSRMSGYDGSVQPGTTTPILSFDRRIEAHPALNSAVESYVELRSGQVELPAYDAADYTGFTPFGPLGASAAPGAKLAETVTYAPQAFLDATKDTLDARLPEYGSDREAWQALGSDPSLVILTPEYAGERGPGPSRPKIDPGQTILLRDPITGAQVEKTVIGRITDPNSPPVALLEGIVLSDSAVGDFQGLELRSSYALNLAPGVDPAATNVELKKEFAPDGAQSQMTDELLSGAQQLQRTFISVIQAFVAFGLIVGVAGLAVISARAVHERRKDIGTLRAVGFGRAAVGWGFIVESSFIALLGILAGILVGTLGGYNLFTAAAGDSGAPFVFPWLQMTLIGLGVWAATLAFTVVPAIRASRVAPVEALRYQG